jgi:RNA polymerase sigma factor (sigma-70 family)
MHLVQRPDTVQLESLPDNKIWEAFQKGNKEALEIIYRRYVNDLYNYGMKIKGHESLIKDCIQELFVELWHSKNNLSSTDNIKYYLLRAIKFKINHHLKIELRHSNTVSQNFYNDKFEYSHEANLIRHQNKEEQKRELYRVMMQLPSKQREVLHLLFFEEFSYKKVSEMMAINLRSVYTLAWKSLSVLRKKIHSTVTD